MPEPPVEEQRGVVAVANGDPDGRKSRYDFGVAAHADETPTRRKPGESVSQPRTQSVDKRDIDGRFNLSVRRGKRERSWRNDEREVR